MNLSSGALLPMTPPLRSSAFPTTPLRSASQAPLSPPPTPPPTPTPMAPTTFNPLHFPSMLLPLPRPTLLPTLLLPLLLPQPPAYLTWLPVSMTSNLTSIAKPRRFATSRPPSPPPFTWTSTTRSNNFATLPSWMISTPELGRNSLPGNQALRLPSGPAKPLRRIVRVGSLPLSPTSILGSDYLTS